MLVVVIPRQYPMYDSVWDTLLRHWQSRQLPGNGTAEVASMLTREKGISIYCPVSD